MQRMLVVGMLIAIVALVAGAMIFRGGRGGAVVEPTGDAAVIAQLRKAGSDLGKPHPVEFFLYFPTEAAAKRIAEKLTREGFAATVKPAASGDLPWHTLATRQLVPTVEAMVKLRTMLTELSTTEGGEYDGWGTPLVK